MVVMVDERRGSLQRDSSWPALIRLPVGGCYPSHADSIPLLSEVVSGNQFRNAHTEVVVQNQDFAARHQASVYQDVDRVSR